MLECEQPLFSLADSQGEWRMLANSLSTRSEPWRIDLSREQWHKRPWSGTELHSMITHTQHLLRLGVNIRPGCARRTNPELWYYVALVHLGAFMNISAFPTLGLWWPVRPKIVGNIIYYGHIRPLRPSVGCLSSTPDTRLTPFTLEYHQTSDAINKRCDNNEKIACHCSNWYISSTHTCTCMHML